MVAFPQTASVAATIVKLASYISSRQYDALPAFFAPNATWYTGGNPTLPGDTGGTVTAVSYINTLRNSAVYDKYSFTITNQVTEGLKSFIEAQVVGDKAPDLHYVNNATFAFTLDREGLITVVRAYEDQIEINYVVQWLKDHNVVSMIFEPFWS